MARVIFLVMPVSYIIKPRMGLFRADFSLSLSHVSDTNPGYFIYQVKSLFSGLHFAFYGLKIDAIFTEILAFKV